MFRLCHCGARTCGDGTTTELTYRKGRARMSHGLRESQPARAGEALHLFFTFNLSEHSGTAGRA